MVRRRPEPGEAAHELAEAVALERLSAAARRGGCAPVPTVPTVPPPAANGDDVAARGQRDAVRALTLHGAAHDVLVTYPAALADRGLPVCYEADVWVAGAAGSANAPHWLGTLYCGLGLDASPSALDGLVALLLDLPALTEAILAQTPDPDVALRVLVATDPAGP